MIKTILFSFISLSLIITGCGKGDLQAEKTAKSDNSGTVQRFTPPPSTTPAADNQESKMNLTPPTLDDVGDPTEVALINTAHGEIVLEFFADKAPLHVANFKKLARAGFYDGTTFHRVIPGFVIQGGDPLSKDDDPNNDGTGGPPYRVKAEFNDIPHEKGSLSMARSGDPNSAGSQFFICLGRTTHLDGQYTNFGRVIKGIETVDKIGNMRRDPSSRVDRTLPAVVMRSVKILKRSELNL